MTHELRVTVGPNGAWVSCDACRMSGLWPSRERAEQDHDRALARRQRFEGGRGA